MEVGVLFWAILFATAVIYWSLPKFRDEFLIGASFSFLVYVISRGTLAQPGELTTGEMIGKVVIANLSSLGILLVWFALFYRVAPKTTGEDARSWRILQGLVLAALAYLAFFKYLPPVSEFLSEQFGLSQLTLKIALPLGISYFTFKLIHYAVEVSRGAMPAHSPREFLLYLLLFTIFPAGPIERFDHFLNNRQKNWSSDLLAVGLQRIIFGLIKKFLIAELMILPYVTYSGESTEGILVKLDSTPVALVWGHLLMWFLYTYLDFSAYSDIAIGSSRLFGFTIQENFNNPLMATNLGDFWRRWHMSLSDWCRSYVYMPVIGITRSPYAAVYATMLSIGLWHHGSLAYMLWGVHHATGLAIFQTWTRFKRKRKIKDTDNPFAKTAARMVTIAYVSVGIAYPICRNFDDGWYRAFQLVFKLVGIVLP